MLGPIGTLRHGPLIGDPQDSSWAPLGRTRSKLVRMAWGAGSRIAVSLYRRRADTSYLLPGQPELRHLCPRPFPPITLPVTPGRACDLCYSPLTAEDLAAGVSATPAFNLLWRIPRGSTIEWLPSGPQPCGGPTSKLTSATK